MWGAMKLEGKPNNKYSLPKYNALPRRHPKKETTSSQLCNRCNHPKTNWSRRNRAHRRKRKPRLLKPIYPHPKAPHPPRAQKKRSTEQSIKWQQTTWLPTCRGTTANNLFSDLLIQVSSLAVSRGLGVWISTDIRSNYNARAWNLTVWHAVQRIAVSISAAYTWARTYGLCWAFNIRHSKCGHLFPLSGIGFS